MIRKPRDTIVGFSCIKMSARVEFQSIPKEKHVNRLKWLFALAALVAILIFLASACNRKGVPARGVLATVNGKEISESEVDRVYHRSIKGQQVQYSGDQIDSLKLNILTSLINDQILLERSAKLGLNATDTEVENRLTELKSRSTEEEFQKSLKDQDYTLEELKHDLQKKITIDKLKNKEITAKISITDAQIADYYQKNKANFNFPPGYRFAHILIANAPDEAKLKEFAQAALNRIRSGEDFTTVAQQRSDDSTPNSPGGQITFASNADLAKTDPALKAAMTALKVGETSDLIRTKQGYLILKLFEIEKGGQHDLSDPRVQTSIRNDLFDQKDRLLTDAFIEDTRDEAKITNYFARRILESASKTAAPPPAK
jgi:peptidyl-prolyl cis-trans isomerase SurA